MPDYAIEFRTLAASAGCGERELHGAYFNGLSNRLLDELNTCDLPTSLDGLVELTMRVDARLAARRASRRLRDPDRSRERSGARSRAPPAPLKHPTRSPCRWAGPSSPGLSDSAAGTTICACTGGKLDTFYPCVQ